MRPQITDKYEFNPDEFNTEGEFNVYPARTRAKREAVLLHVSVDHLMHNFSRATEIIEALKNVRNLKADGLVPIIDLLEPATEDLHIYFVERRPERTLRDFYLESDLIDESDAVDAIRSLLSGLAQLHDNDLAHNALSDSCVYLIERGRRFRVQIGRPEFIAKVGEHMVHPYIPEFGAPELYSEAASTASKQADLYAVGMIAYKLLASREQYESVFSQVFDLDEAHQEEVWKNLHTDPGQEIPRLDHIIPGFEPALADLVARLMSRDPAERPTEAADVLAELEGVPRTLRPTTGGGRITRKEEPQAPRGWWQRQSAGMRVAMAVAAVFWILACGAVGYKLLRVDPAVIAEANALAEQTERLRKEVAEGGGSQLGNRDRLRITVVDAENAASRGEGHLAKRDFKDSILAYRDAVTHFEQVQAQLNDRMQKAQTARDLAIKAKAELDELGDEDTGDRTEALALLERGEAALTAKQFTEASTLFTQVVAAIGKARRTVLERKATAEQARLSAVSARDRIPPKGQARDPNFRKGAAALASAEASFGRRKWSDSVPLYGQSQALFETAASNPTIECSETKAKLSFVMVPAGTYEIRDPDIARVAARYLGAQNRLTIDEPFCLQAGKATFGALRPYMSHLRMPMGRGPEPMPADAVSEITFLEAVGFAELLSRETGETYALPNLRQWLAGMAFLSVGSQWADTAATFFAQPREWLSGDCSSGSAFVGGPHFRDEATKLQCIDSRLRNPQIGFRLVLSR